MANHPLRITPAVMDRHLELAIDKLHVLVATLIEKVVVDIAEVFLDLNYCLYLLELPPELRDEDYSFEVLD